MNELHEIFIINSSHVKFVMKLKLEFISYLRSHPKDSKHFNSQSGKTQLGMLGMCLNPKTLSMYISLSCLNLGCEPMIRVMSIKAYIIGDKRFKNTWFLWLDNVIKT
jgi:hypothetical protein